MPRICPVHVHIGSGNVATNFRTGLYLAIFDLEITRAKFPLVAGYHFHRIVGTQPINLANGRLQVVEIGFHISKLRSHFPGTVTTFEGFPFAIYTRGMLLTPFWKGLSKRFCRDNMFPFNALCSIMVFLRLRAATRQIDLTPSVGTFTVEFDCMSSKNLCQKFLRTVEGIDASDLGESGKH